MRRDHINNRWEKRKRFFLKTIEEEDMIHLGLNMENFLKRWIFRAGVTFTVLAGARSGKVMPVLESCEGKELKVEQWPNSRRGAKHADIAERRAGVEGCRPGGREGVAPSAAGLHVGREQREKEREKEALTQENIIRLKKKVSWTIVNKLKGVRGP